MQWLVIQPWRLLNPGVIHSRSHVLSAFVRPAANGKLRIAHVRLHRLSNQFHPNRINNNGEILTRARKHVGEDSAAIVDLAERWSPWTCTEAFGGEKSDSALRGCKIRAQLVVQAFRGMRETARRFLWGKVCGDLQFVVPKTVPMGPLYTFNKKTRRMKKNEQDRSPKR